MNRLKTTLSRLFWPLGGAFLALTAALALTGCATGSLAGGTAFNTGTAVAIEQATVESVAILILQKNPTYVPAVRQLAASIAVSGAVDPAGVVAAVNALPGLDAKTKGDLLLLAPALEAGLAAYAQATGKTLAPTDPNVIALETGFSTALTAAVSAVSP